MGHSGSYGNTDPSFRRASELLKKTGGNPQKEVDRIQQEMREKAVSPLDLVAEALSFVPKAGKGN